MNLVARPSLIVIASILYLSNTSIAQEDVVKDKNDKPSVGPAIQKAYESSTQAATHKEYGQTIRLCDEALQLNPSPAQITYLNQLKSWVHLSRAKLFESRIKPNSNQESDPIQLAIQDCTSAIELNPDNWKAYAHRAKRYCDSGKTKVAIQDLDKAIRKKSDNIDLWFNRAELLFAQKQYEIAIADYSEVLKTNKGDVQALTGRAHCYVRLSKLDLALMDYDHVIERTNKSATAFLNRADIHLKMKNYKAAGDDYRAALTRDTTLAQAYRGVAWMYATSKKDNYYNPTVADRSIKRAIELDGKETPDNLVVLAAAQAAAGEYSMARDTLKRVKSSNNLSPEGKERYDEMRTQKWYVAGTGRKENLKR